MLTSPSRLWLFCLLALLPAAPLAAQEAPPPEAETAPAGISLSDMSLEQLMAGALKLRATKQYDKAIDVLRHVLQRDPSNIDAMRMMGAIAWELQDAQKAKEYWLMALRIQPNDFGANFGLGRMYLASDIQRNAMHHLETARTVVPNDPDRPELGAQVLTALARAYQGSGMYAQAEATILEAINSIDALVRSQSGSAMLEVAQFEAAYVLVTLWNEAARTTGDFDRAIGAAARLVAIGEERLPRDGATPERVQRLQVAYELHLQVLYDSGDVLFERNPDGRLSDRVQPGKELRAAATVSMIVEIMLKQAKARQLMSYFQIADLAATAVAYDKGTNPRTLSNLASLLILTERTDDAIKVYERILEIDPDNAEAQQGLEKLSAGVPEPVTTQPAATEPVTPTP